MEAMIEQLQAAPLENAGLVEALKKQCGRTGDLATNTFVDTCVSDSITSECNVADTP